MRYWPRARIVSLSFPTRQRLQRSLMLVFFVCAGLLFLSDRARLGLLTQTRIVLSDVLSVPLSGLGRGLGAVSAQLKDWRGYFALNAINQDLKTEVDALSGWRLRAKQLESENSVLRGLLNAPALSLEAVATGRVFVDQSGGFARSLLVNVGRRDGILIKQAAITRHGLVGQVVAVGERSARILLVTDVNSRIPVIVGPARHRAIFSGRNAHAGLLIYLDPEAQVSVGDEVVTSGYGGLFPPGIPVGLVTAAASSLERQGQAVVLPYMAHENLELVRLVGFPPIDIPPPAQLSAPRHGAPAASPVAQNP